MKRSYLTIVLAALVALPATATAVRAEDNGGVTAADSVFREIRNPRVIDHPGDYYLGRNIFSGQGTAIMITANDVTLDLAGYSIYGPGERKGFGIMVSGAHNVRIFNGHLQQLGIGVFLDHATNVTVEELQIDGIDSGGAPPDVEIGVMLVETRGARIQHNVITNTFLGVFVRGEESGGNRVADNLITGGTNGELAICYNPAPGETTGGPDGDLVTGNVVSHFRRGLSLDADSAGNVIRGNTIAYFDIDIQEAHPGSNVIDGNDLVQISR
jgi:nitrous oxidase accessory protein NosD